MLYWDSLDNTVGTFKNWNITRFYCLDSFYMYPLGLSYILPANMFFCLCFTHSLCQLCLITGYFYGGLIYIADLSEITHISLAAWRICIYNASDTRMAKNGL